MNPNYLLNSEHMSGIFLRLFSVQNMIKWYTILYYIFKLVLAVLKIGRKTVLKKLEINILQKLIKNS